MAKRALLFLLTIFLTFSFSVGVVMAQPATETPPADNSNSTTTVPPTTGTETSTTNGAPVWSAMYDNDTKESYENAIQADNCATPSLECLVHQTTKFMAIEFANSMISQPNNPQRGQTKNGPGSSLNNHGVITGIGMMIDAMYSYRPAGTSLYLADVMKSAHIVPKAYAQGLGFSALSPVLELWKAFRNIAYMFFIVVIIVIGFMIMFKRGDGQASVTAQQAIPTVVVSLILVTFSYAIAGLLIDGMYLTMYMIIGIFGVTGDNIDARLIDYDIFTLMWKLFNPVQTTFDNGTISVAFFTNLLQNQLLGTGLGWIGGITFTVVITVAVLIGTFRLFFELLKSYASIIMGVVTAPIVLMLGAIPGRKNVFMDWIWDLIGNLSAFPTVLMVLILYFQFAKIGADSGTAAQEFTGGFLPPFLMNNVNQVGLISSLMGLAIILALPDIVKDVKKRMGASEGGFGMMIANSAMTRLGEGYKGGEIIPYLGVRAPGVKDTLGYGKTALWGTEKSNQRAKDQKFTVLGRGLLGGIQDRYNRYQSGKVEDANKHVPYTSETKPERSNSQKAPISPRTGKAPSNLGGITIK